MPFFLTLLSLFLVSVPWARFPEPRALPNADAAPWGHPATSETFSPQGFAHFWNGPAQRSSVELLSPLDDRSAFYAGYARAEPWQLWHQELNAGASVRLYSGTWIGARGELFQGDGEENLDLSFGALYRPGRHVAMAWDVRHLLESLPDGSVDQGKRTWGLGGALFVDRNERIVLHGDAASHGFAWSDLRRFESSGGVRLRVGDAFTLTLSTGLMATVDSVQRYGSKDLDGYWALQFGIPVSRHRIDFSVGGEDYVLKGTRHNPSLHVALGLVGYAGRDRTPPLAAVRLDSNQTFQMQAQDDSRQFRDWQLLVHRSGPDFLPRAMVRRYAGQGIPPQLLAFDGNDLRGEQLPPGLYGYRLLVRDAAGNSTWSSWLFVELP